MRLNLDHTVRGRVASYVWGPDIGSSWLGQSSWQQAGGVGGLLMVIDGVATSPHSGTTTDPIDDDYVDSLAPHARLALRAAVGGLPRLPPVALVPLMDRMRNVTGYKKAHTSVPAAQLDAIYDYDAFGNEIRSTVPAADTVPYHFSTKRVDSTTGLVYYGYRWYDPAKGRWIGRDPIGEEGGENPFHFVGNRVTRSVDPTGRNAISLPPSDGGIIIPKPIYPPVQPPPPLVGSPAPVPIPLTSQLLCLDPSNGPSIGAPGKFDLPDGPVAGQDDLCCVNGQLVREKTRYEWMDMTRDECVLRRISDKWVAYGGINISSTVLAWRTGQEFVSSALAEAASKTGGLITGVGLSAFAAGKVCDQRFCSEKEHWDDW